MQYRTLKPYMTVAIGPVLSAGSSAVDLKPSKVWALAAAGEPEEARRDVAAQRATGVPRSWPRDTNWLSATMELSEAAYLLGDIELGAELEELLAPFTDRLVVSARALMCMGSVAGVLGRLAELRGDRDAAISYYEQAIEREDWAGVLIWATNHRRRLAEVYAAAGRTYESDRLLSVVKDHARAMGLTRVAHLADQPERLDTGRISAGGSESRGGIAAQQPLMAGDQDDPALTA